MILTCHICGCFWCIWRFRASRLLSHSSHPSTGQRTASWARCTTVTCFGMLLGRSTLLHSFHRQTILVLDVSHSFSGTATSARWYSSMCALIAFLEMSRGLPQLCHLQVGPTAGSKPSRGASPG